MSESKAISGKKGKNNKNNETNNQQRLRFVTDKSSEDDDLEEQQSEYEEEQEEETEEETEVVEEEVMEKCLSIEETEVEKTVKQEEEEEGYTQMSGEILLSPDNPILEKFQKALKDHLLKQIALMEGEIFDLESDTKMANAEKENLSLEAYEIQQNVNKQMTKIKTCEEQLLNVMNANEQLEHELQNALKEYKDIKDGMYQAEREDIVLEKEVEAVDLLHKQMSIWEEQVESELVVSQRVFEKSEKEKLQAIALKREQDAFIYKIMKEIWKLEGEIETKDMQTKVKEEERENLANEIAMVNITLETFYGEHKCLIQSWNSLLVAIAYRDKLYCEMDNNLEQKSEQLRVILSEVEAVKKLTVKEMQRNEELGIFKERVLQELQNYTKRFKAEYEKKSDLDENISETQRIIDQTNYDIEVVRTHIEEEEKIEFFLQRDIQELDTEESEVNNQILSCLEEQVTNDKSSKYLKTIVRDFKDKNRNLEISLVSNQNLNSKMNMEIESTKFLIEMAHQDIKEIYKQEKVLEEEIDSYKEDIKVIQKEMLKKGRLVTVLYKKIDIIIKQTGGLEVSPIELKIYSLEKSLRDQRQEISKFENFWLREQTYVVNLTQQRQKQMQDLNLMKKQTVLLTQKNLKLADELNAFSRETEILEKNSSKMLNQLELLNEKIIKMRGTKENIDFSLVSKQNDYEEVLETNEMDLLNLEQDCLEIEKDMQNLSDQLVQVNRDYLAWEKKLMMILELKKQIKDEQSESGEIGTMKLEIHRMQVRLGQLKKAQDKLILDLQHCLTRREAIVSSKEAREKKTKGGVDQTRVNFDRKLLDTRIKREEIQKDTEVITEKLKSADQEKQEVYDRMLESEKEIEDFKQNIEKCKEYIEKMQVENEKTQSILTIKQKKLSIYVDLLKGKQPYILYHTDKVINPELDKQRELNHILVTIIQKAAAEFPEHEEHFSRINQILTIPLMHL